MNKTLIDICICRRKCRASATNNKMKQVPDRETNKKKTWTVGKKTGPAVNRWHHQLARACLRSHLGMCASSCRHEKNNCIPRERAGESTWSETRASVTQKQSWLSSTRSQLPANTVINELQWNEMKANESFNAVTCRKASGPVLRRHPAWGYFSQSQEVLEISQALECLTKNWLLGGSGLHRRPDGETEAEAAKMQMWSRIGTAQYHSHSCTPLDALFEESAELC